MWRMSVPEIQGRRGVTSSVIAVTADHTGFALKNSMKVVLDEHGFPLVDLGARLIGPEVACDCLLTFVKTPLDGAHARRVAKMSAPVP
jgi:ribose 5-phosphate isomerase RpiB